MDKKPSKEGNGASKEFEWPKPLPPKCQPFAPDSMLPAEFRFKTLHVNAHPGIGPDDAKEALENPDVWLHLQHQLGVSDEITVFGHGGTFVAKAQVLQFEPGFPPVIGVSSVTKLPEAQRSSRDVGNPDYEMRFSPHSRTYACYRKADGKAITHSFATRADAVIDFQNFLKQQNPEKAPVYER